MAQTYRAPLASLLVAVAVSFPVAVPANAVGSAAQGGCHTARQELTAAKQTAAAVYRAELKAARKEYRRSEKQTADRRELAAHRADARQARRALVARAASAVAKQC